VHLEHDGGSTRVHALAHELFEAQVARTPDAVALAVDGNALTYAALDARANRLAHALRARGVRPGRRVAICASRCPELWTAVLAVWKAGGAYVPLDPSYPAARLAWILQDSTPALLLTTAESAAVADALLADHERGGVATLRVDADAPWRAAAPATPPARAGLTPADLAYVIYTSGSTGRPKGVMIEHRGVCNLVAAQGAAFAVDGSSRVLQFASSSFDASVFEACMALMRGATLCLPPMGDGLAGDALTHALATAQVTHVTLPPAVLATLPSAADGEAGDALVPVRTLVLAGDVVPAGVARQWGADRRIVNAYGPTETTVWATAHECRRSERGAPGIGRPIANMQAHVLDAEGAPTPVGVAGELYVGGAGVARGYLNRPALTAERFVPDPFSGEPGARLYRTGDRARRRRTGQLDFVGRADFQVKVRGFRVELGEVEAQLREHPDVSDAVVVAREEAPGDVRLVAYWASLGATDAGPEALRAHLAERLPEHMVPAAYVRLAALPLTPSGKPDRRALPAPGMDAYATHVHAPPVGPTEETLAAIWRDVLRLPRVGRSDHFFELGGHSLLAVQVISRVRDACHVTLPAHALFQHPTIAGLARFIDERAAVSGPPPDPVPLPRPAVVPASIAQTAAWFFEQIVPQSAAYQAHATIVLDGPLDVPALEQALSELVRRHEVLRTTFVARDGALVQQVHEPWPVSLPPVDLTAVEGEAQRVELQRRLDESFRTGFSRIDALPLVRWTLFRLAPSHHVLAQVEHHFVHDGWSFGLLLRELFALYEGLRTSGESHLPAPRAQFADFALWERQWLQSDEAKAQIAFWTHRLAGAPPRLALPTNRPRPDRITLRGTSFRVTLPPELCAAAEAFSRRHGVTLFTTMLAAFEVLMLRYSSQDDFCVGSGVANRHSRAVEDVVGMVVNTVALRADVRGDPTVLELVQAVQRTTGEAFAREGVPFSAVVEALRPERRLDHLPIYQVGFSFHDSAVPVGRIGELSVAVNEALSNGTAKLDLQVVGIPRRAPDGDSRDVTLIWEYSTDLFDAATVAQMARHYRLLLAGLVAEPEARISRLRMLSDEDWRQVVEEWNATGAPYPADACLHELFAEHAARTPDAIAVTSDAEAITYGELDARTNRLARHLRALGVGPDARVALCLQRSPAMTVALLAVMRAGGAYVPLDPEYPAERLDFMLADSAPIAMLTDRATAALAGRAARDARGGAMPVLVLDGPVRPWERESATPFSVAGLTAAHLAYVIYTSGSTGRPKGVAVPHRGVVNFLFDLERRQPLPSGAACPLWTSISFDVSVCETFNALAFGRPLHLPPEAARTEPAAFVRWLSAARIANAYVPVFMLQELEAWLRVRGSSESALRRLIVGVEPIPEGLLAAMRAHVPGLRVLNGYGPTEASIGSTFYEVPSRDAGDVAPEPGPAPIGRPLSNGRAYVLDGAGAPVPVGVAGEIYIGGAGVVRGYLSRPALTAERFVPDPFSREGGARLYRTGDLGRWRADGQVEFLGRADFQMKVRGFRVELGEIEARLREHASVGEAVVVAREDTPGDTRLVAYWTSLGTADGGPEALRAHLAERLPEYMVPAAFVRLDALPLTPNGKLDRRALPAPEGDAYVRRAYEAPRDDVERAVAEIWREVLGVERVGRWDHFFELGGHSLLAVRVLSRVRNALGADAELAALFARPVLADFAAALAGAARAAVPTLAPAPRTGRVPLSFAQQRLWFLEQLGGLGTAYSMRKRIRLHGALDRAALGMALDRIIARHEALRTTFPAVDGAPEQRVASVAEAGGLRLVDDDQMGGEDEAPFDLARGPLIRGRLVRLAPDEHVLQLTMHHVVSDAWSMGVFVRELGALYAAFHAGRPDPLPPLPVQYADYAVWQRRWVDGERLQRQAEYWRAALAGVPEALELPTDRPRPARWDARGGAVAVALDAELTAALRALSRRHGTTLFMTLLAGWAAVLGRLSGQADLVIGTPTANRGQREIEGLIGFFVNTLALRADLTGTPTVAELLARVKARVLEAQAHQDIPFEQVVERLQPVRSLARTPLFQVMFVWETAREPVELAGLRAEETDASAGAAKFDLTLALTEVDGGLRGQIQYAAALFDAATVERHAGYLRRVLAAMVTDDRRPIAELPLLPDEERELLVHAWNRTAAIDPAGSCVHEWIEAQVARTPAADAVAFEGVAVSYEELNARANRLAHHLRALGVGPDRFVALCMTRSLEMVVSLLAVLKAGGAYVPLDPQYPAERLHYMAEDSEPRVVLTQRPLRAMCDGIRAVVLEVTAEGTESAAYPRTNPDHGDVTPEHLAYLSYTSGSTGRPKGVMICHRSLMNYVTFARSQYAGGQPANFPLHSSLGFDLTVTSIFVPLLTGGTIVVYGDGVDAKDGGAALRRALQDDRVDVVKLTPSHLLALRPRDVVHRRVKRLIVGGEDLTTALARSFSDASGGALAIDNEYGPTEATVGCTVHTFDPAADVRGSVPIGGPIRNAQMYIADHRGAPAPVGVIGEMYIGGVGLARGYWRRPALTAERFVPDWLSGTPGARLYTTGDLGRWLGDGTMEFLGRSDRQVKVRGVRIELGEIESRLLEHPGVDEAAVLAREGARGRKQLVAYWVGDARTSTDMLRTYLVERLPDAMVPSAYVRVEALPRTSHGKLDATRLPSPTDDAYARRTFEAPQGEVEESLAAVWSGVLGVERVGRWDHFFELGGHSLLAVQVIERLRQRGLRGGVQSLFLTPVLADFASALGRDAPAEHGRTAPAEDNLGGASPEPETPSRHTLKLTV
jgi:amino acid adenylation domain-containing protein